MKRRALSKGKHESPNHHVVAKYLRDGFSEIQAYVRAFNDANHLHHTAFELTPQNAGVKP